MNDQAGQSAVPAISFNPTDAISGGTVIDDVQAQVVSIRSCLFDYHGKAPQPTVALHAHYRYMVEGQTVDAHEYYSAGDPKNLIPSQDGRQLIPVGSQGGLNDNCNALLFMSSWVNAGFTQAIGNDLAVFDGWVVHVKRVPGPKRNIAGSKGDGKVLLVQKVLGQAPIAPAPVQTGAQAMQSPQMGMGQAIPGGNPFQMGQVQPTPAAPPAPGGFQFGGMAPAPQAPLTPAPQVPMLAPGGDLVTAGAQALVALLAANGGSLQKSDLPIKAFTALANDPNRNALVQMFLNDQFLGMQGAPWKYQGTTISL